MPGGVLIGLLCQTSARRPTAASEAARVARGRPSKMRTPITFRYCEIEHIESFFILPDLGRMPSAVLTRRYFDTSLYKKLAYREIISNFSGFRPHLPHTVS